jgi:hypothetical protein
MNTEINLEPFIEDCPSVWIKFSRQVIDQTAIYTLNGDEAVKQLNILLKEYHAEYMHEINGMIITRRYIKFDSEEHKTWFILKWS